MEQRSTEGEGCTPARVITRRITQAVSASQVLDIMQAEQENPNMDLIAVATAWTRLAQLQRSINAETTNSPAFLMLVCLTGSLLERPAGLARAVANIFWAAARLHGSMSPQLAALWPSLARAIRTTVNDLNAQGVANVIWAVAKLANAGIEVVLGLLPVLAARVPAVISEMIEQHVSNVIWATGQLSVEPFRSGVARSLREALPDLVARAGVLLPTAKPQAIGNICWGMALCGYYDDVLFGAVAARVTNEAAGWSHADVELNLSWVLCALARLKATGHQDLMDTAAKILPPMLSKISDWSLCALSWSFQQLDSGNFDTFRQSLEAEVTSRGIPEDDVERSRFGPETWKQANQRHK